MTLKAGSRTKWGKADHVTNVAPGIQNVSTPGHGGYKLDRARNAEVHAAWRREGGWYEEDCEWSIVWLTFEQAFRDHAPTDHVFRSTLEQAHHTARQYYPDEYTAVTGSRVTPEQSRELRRRQFAADNRANYVATSAWGEWHAKVPAGFVGVVARKAGTDRTDQRYFLIPAADYEAREEFGLVIRPEHQEWSDHP